MTVIGPTFGAELQEAGLGGLPFTWGPEGLGDTSQLTPEQLDGVNAVLAEHDPTRTEFISKYEKSFDSGQSIAAILGD